jgi:hypothetical protein
MLTAGVKKPLICSAFKNIIYVRFDTLWGEIFDYIKVFYSQRLHSGTAYDCPFNRAT